MATVTPNFNWPVPTSTDLVKDGATAIEALGDSIDASLVDLKGGTTGQVLSKTSNTDMDFTWVAADDTNAIQNTIVDAKGDLIAASAADTPARLAVGNNGETLVADSSTSTGLRYQGNFAAGLNKLINGDCSIWQRGTSISVGAFDPKYTLDRWYYFTATGSNTITQETTTVPAGNLYAAKWTSGAAGGTFAQYQIIETANAQSLAGKTVTAQVQATGTTGKNVRVIVDYSTTANASAGSSFTGISGSSETDTVTSGTFTTFKITCEIPSNAKTVRVGVVSTSTFANTEFVIWANAKLEIGSVATAFQTATGTIQGELAACQRYYYQVGGAIGVNPATGHYYSATNAYLTTPFPVTMRTSPSVAITNTSSWSVYSTGSGRAVTSFAFSTSSPISSTCLYTSSSGGTAGYGGWLESTNANAGLSFSAEL
jgi:hypothetical protein